MHHARPSPFPRSTLWLAAMSLVMVLGASAGRAQPVDAAGAAAAPAASAAAAWKGKYTGTSLSVVIEQKDGKHHGTLTRDGKTFNFTGEIKGEAFAGVLDVDGLATAFAASLAGDTLTLKLGLDTHKLSRADAGDLAGTFAGNELAITIVQQEGEYRGTITRGTKEFSFTGRKEKDGQFLGVIDVDGDQTGFAMTLTGEELTLKLGLDSYKLKRLAQPKPPIAKAANTLRKEILLAKSDEVQAGSLVVSPDNRRVAFIDQRDGQRRFAINGVLSKPYLRALRITFSADGGRYFHLAQRTDGQACVVVDGNESEPYDTLAEEVARFSPDGKHIAFAAVRDGKWRIVIDGKEGPACNGIQHITFSPDSGRLAYGSKKDGKWRVMIDGVEQPAYDDLGRAGIRFSADGKRVAYTAIKGSQECLVIDGKEGTLYDAIPGFHLSPDGLRVHYFAIRDRQSIYIADGQEKGTYDKLAGLDFSPDGKRMVLGARSAGKSFQVIDDQRQLPFDDVSAPVFSPDGKQVVYAARRGDKWLLIRDQREGEPHDDVVFVAISPNSQRLAYGAVDGKVAVVIVDGKAAGSYHEIWEGGLHFSPDNRHLVYGARRGDQWFLIVNGVEGEPIGAFVANSHPVFDGPDQFSVVTRRGSSYHRLEVRIVEEKPAK